MFDQATRQKLRFTSSRGELSVEELWDLPLTSMVGKPNLDDIALSLHRELRSTAEVASFVDEKSKTDPTVQLRFDIVKHIIDTRKEENQKEAKRRESAETKQRLLEILAKKQDAHLEALPIEELQKKIAEL
jgi:hypothetical protein